MLRSSLIVELFAGLDIAAPQGRRERVLVRLPIPVDLRLQRHVDRDSF
jgi:hypothetical protein